MKLAKIKYNNKKRVGRGYGSGKGGHTVGRGQKGQKARRTIGVLFEGLKMKKSLIKRLPFKRGKDKFKPKNKPMVVNLEVLNILPDGTEVNSDVLVTHRIVDKNSARKYGIKILGNGEITKKLTISLPISNSAALKVEKAGGKISTKTPIEKESKTPSKSK